MKTNGTALNNLRLHHVSRLIKGSKTEVEVKATKQIAALLHKTKDTDLKKKGGKKMQNACYKLSLAETQTQNVPWPLCDHSVHHNLHF